MSLDSFSRDTRQPKDTRQALQQAEITDARLLPRFLDAAELLEVLDVAESLVTSELHVSHIHDSDVSTLGHDVSFSPSHVALNLHRGDHFFSQAPALHSKLVAGMLSSSCEDHAVSDLSVRCMELHTYVIGEGLTTVGHKDHGSVLSMSILLSNAGDFGGGQLMTWGAGSAPVMHAMERGDALVFPSLKTHNVSPITSGERQTLVIELWRGAANRSDRYR